MAKIKICGLFRDIDIDYVNQTNPDYIGFIIGFPKSHRNITNEQVQKFKNNLNSNINSVGVFVNATFEEILDVEQYLNVIQLHGSEDDDYIKKLREKIPNKEIWKAFKIKNIEDITLAQKSCADKVVLDNGYGTGECFDWRILENLQNTQKFILAGGITPCNIKEAIQKFNPVIIDISSGVETDKQKDLNKIKQIIEISKQ